MADPVTFMTDPITFTDFWASLLDHGFITKMYFRRRDGVRTQEHGPYVPPQATPPPPPPAPAPAPAPAAGALVLVSSPGYMEIDSGDDDVNSRAGDSEDDIRKR